MHRGRRGADPAGGKGSGPPLPRLDRWPGSSATYETTPRRTYRRAAPVSSTSSDGGRSSRPSGRVQLRAAGDGGDELRLTYGELDRRARALGARLQELGLGGERRLLLYPPGLDSWRASSAACTPGWWRSPPTPPAQPADAPASRDRLRLPAGGRPDDRGPAGRGGRWCAQVPELEEPAWLATDGASTTRPRRRLARPGPAADALAFLQYTSGSTADAKGVMVTHGNLVAQLGPDPALFRRRARRAGGSSGCRSTTTWG